MKITIHEAKKSEARFYTLWASFGKYKGAYYAVDANGDSWSDDPDEAYEFSSRSDANKAIKSFVDTLNSGVGDHFNWTADKVFITPQFRKTEAKKSESIVSDIRKNKPKVLLSDDAVNYFDDYDDMLDEFETAYQTYVHVSGNPDEDILFLYEPDDNIVAIGDFDVDHEARDRAKELMEKFVRGELVKATGDIGGLDYVVIEDGNTYTATAFVERE